MMGTSDSGLMCGLYIRFASKRNKLALFDPGLISLVTSIGSLSALLPILTELRL